MKRRYFLFIIIILASTIIINYSFKFIAIKLFDNFLSTNKQLENLNISYKDYSINLFSPIIIKDIEIEKNKNKLLIPNIKISLNYLELTKFNLNTIITAITIENPNLNITDLSDFENNIINEIPAPPDKKKNTNLLNNTPINIIRAGIIVSIDNDSLMYIDDLNLSIINNQFEGSIGISRIDFNDNLFNYIKEHDITISEEIENILTNLKLLTFDNLNGSFNDNYIDLIGYFNGGIFKLAGKTNDSLLIQLENVPFFYDYVSVYLNTNIVYNSQDKFVHGTVNLNNLFVGLLPLPDLNFNINYLNEKYFINMLTKYGEHEIKIDFEQDMPILYFESPDFDLSLIDKNFQGVVDYNVYLNLFSDNKEMMISVAADSIYYSDITFSGGVELLFSQNKFNFSTENLYINENEFDIISNGYLKDNKYHFEVLNINKNYKLNNFILQYADNNFIFENIQYKKIKNICLDKIKFDYKDSKFYIEVTGYDKYKFSVLADMINKNNILLTVIPNPSHKIFNDSYTYNLEIKNDTYFLKSHHSPIDIKALYNNSSKNYNISLKSNDILNTELQNKYGKNAFANIDIIIDYLNYKNIFFSTGDVLITNVKNLDLFRVNIVTDTETNIINFNNGILKTDASLLYYKSVYNQILKNIHFDFNINELKTGNIISSGNIEMDLNIPAKNNFNGLISSNYYKIGNFDIRNLKFGFEFNKNNNILNIIEYPEKTYTLNGSIDFSENIKTNITFINEGVNIAYLKGITDLNNNYISLNILNDKNNISLLPLYSPLINNAEGQGQINITLEGEISNPKYIGVISLVDVNLDLNFYLRELNNLNGDIIFEQNIITIDNLTATNDKRGRININGSGSDFKDLQLEISAKNVRIHIPVYEANFLADINGTFITTDTNYIVIATADMFNGILTYPPPQQQGRQYNKKKPGYWTYPFVDVQLNTKSNFRFTNSFANVLLAERSKLKLYGPGNNLELTGLIRSTMGTVNYLNKNLRITDGTVKFTEADNIPILDIESSSTISDIDITLRIIGPANDLETVMSSSSHPNLSNEELLRLLRFGQVDKISIEHQQEQVITDIVSLIDANFMQELLKPLRTNLEKELGITLDIDAPILANIAKRTFISDRETEDNEVNFFENTYFSVGKFLSDKFYLNYRGLLKTADNISMQNSPLYLKSEIEARYFFHPRLTFQYIFKPELEYVKEEKEHFFMFQYRLQY